MEVPYKNRALTGNGSNGRAWDSICKPFKDYLSLR